MLDMNQIKKNVVRWSKNGDRDTTDAGESHTPVTRSATKTAGAAATGKRTPANIGASILFKGELSGDEDFVIQGRVEGRINLDNNNLTVGKEGRIRADIVARVITVEGELVGDMFGTEKVIIRATGRVKGNIISPRVTLEDGAKFKGSIEMDPQAVEVGDKGDKRAVANESA